MTLNNTFNTVDKLECPGDILALVPVNQSEAALSWTAFDEPVNMSLSVGEHHFYYRMVDKSDCNFIISVRGNQLSHSSSNRCGWYK